MDSRSVASGKCAPEFICREGVGQFVSTKIVRASETTSARPRQAKLTYGLSGTVGELPVTAIYNGLRWPRTETDNEREPSETSWTQDGASNFKHKRDAKSNNSLAEQSPLTVYNLTSNEKNRGLVRTDRRYTACLHLFSCRWTASVKHLCSGELTAFRLIIHCSYSR